MISKIIFWIPRILGILAVLLVMMFSFDCLEGDYNLKEKLVCFLMHNIPSLILILILVIAWRWELFGGIVFVIGAVIMTGYFDGFSGNPGVMVLTLPFLVVGTLFIVSDLLKRRKL